ncbi:cation:proton antiporter [Metaclostridioides mangenotii]|uniref:cation:proton antiporter n=1 Tax=Metaclostridioides mangenotii TaxID=1540 RepID=UPI0028EFA90C|nr:cation:proton antiporter [Clostridioides mangenotii]
MDLLLKLSIVIITGFIGGKIVERFKLPNVCGYLIAGLFLGPSFFHLITIQESAGLNIISEVALSCIAFSIGSEFIIKEMKILGKAIFIITLLEVIGAVFVVFIIMFYGFKQPFAFSIVIASMSASTAPAATLMVIKQYRASGPLSKTVLPVVALDDVLGIIAFGLAISIAKISMSTGNQANLTVLMQPFIEIIGSLILGIIAGFILLMISKRTKNNEEVLIITLGMIALTTGLANLWNLSSLLACIMLGVIIFNFKKNPLRISSALNKFTPPIYLLFFTLAGVSLDLNILSQVGPLGLSYIFARASGKMIGTLIGTKLAKSPKTVQQNLGLTLLPQGGISIGLSVIVQQQLPTYAPMINTIIMFGVLIFETTGPIFTKIAIQRAGEIDGMDRILVNENDYDRKAIS